jgi:chemotaxis protein CheZ
MNNMTGPGNPQLCALGQDGMPVFERLGIIVRALHDTLSEIGAQDVLADAAREFPSARERLLHIADLTENAANLVLGKVEQNVPLLDDLAHQAAALEHSWDGADASAADAQLVAGTRAFLAQVQQGCGTTRLALSDIMMAQDFQDLTGQLIKKVVVLMERTENDLLKLLIDAAPPDAMAKVAREEIMAGPGAPGNIALDQGSVDDLLADLGF